MSPSAPDPLRRPALRAGAMTIALGLSPLALCFRTARQAGWWGGACVLTFLVLLATLLSS